MSSQCGGMIPRKPIKSKVEPHRQVGTAISARKHSGQEIPEPADIDIDINLIRAAADKYETIYGVKPENTNIVESVIYGDIYVQWSQAIKCFNEYYSIIPSNMPEYDGVVIVDRANMAFGLFTVLQPGGSVTDMSFQKTLNLYLSVMSHENPSILFVVVKNGRNTDFVINGNIHFITVACDDDRYTDKCRDLHGFVEADDFVAQLVYYFYAQITKSVGIMSQDGYSWHGTSSKRRIRNTYVFFRDTKVHFGSYYHGIWFNVATSFTKHVQSLQQPIVRMDQSEDMDLSEDIDWMDLSEDPAWSGIEPMDET